jgi:hypothetical protein
MRRDHHRRRDKYGLRIMPDSYLDWGGDFQLSATGGLLLADGVTFANQRILRRILTAVHGYVWHPSYGMGLPRMVGRFANITSITALARSQMALESSVSPAPAPIITVTNSDADAALYIIKIQYTAAATGEPVTLSFTT